jgi:hypothetical protein
MAKIIKKLRYGTLRECEESDPIYSEGWTIGAVIRPRQTEETPKEVCRNADSPLTLQAEDERRPNG